ncbi:MAG: DUF2330 domain-containing protein [Polyangiaceae bacterium]
MKSLALFAPLALATSLGSNSAEACGGCFVPPSENTVVSGHRMALSVSPKQTVLWDQIQYQGNPEDFSWVLPIKPGARIEAADPGWFEALEASTVTEISAPPLQCNNGGGAFGCGDSGGFGTSLAAGGDFENEGGGVTVVKQETVGPYDSVTLASEDANALTDWLEAHNYDIPEDVKPVIAAYVEDGFDFIALRLTPGNGVNLMSPVRVITEGASPVLPLRMVAAGTGAFTSVVLYVIGEGRWTTQNFPEVPVPYGSLVWDGETNESNYAELRGTALASNQGRSWISTYAKRNALFGYNYETDEYGGNIGSTYIGTLIDDSGSNYNEVSDCQQEMQSAAQGTGVVVELACDPDTGVCEEPGRARWTRAGSRAGLTDLAVALVGMHPGDVWVTRLEANLPRTALGEDLALEASESQAQVDNFHETPKTENYECPASPGGPGGRKGKMGDGTPMVVVGLGALAVLLAARRRSLVRA